MRHVHVGSRRLQLPSVTGGTSPATTIVGSLSIDAVGDAPASDTWHGCHAPGGGATRGGALDFSVHANVYTNRVKIRCGVSEVALTDCSGSPPPNQFPIAAPFPAAMDGARMVAWITAGAPQ